MIHMMESVCLCGNHDLVIKKKKKRREVCSTPQKTLAFAVELLLVYIFKVIFCHWKRSSVKVPWNRFVTRLGGTCQCYSGESNNVDVYFKKEKAAFLGFLITEPAVVKT